MPVPRYPMPEARYPHPGRRAMAMSNWQLDRVALTRVRLSAGHPVLARAALGCFRPIADRGLRIAAVCPPRSGLAAGYWRLGMHETPGGGPGVSWEESRLLVQRASAAFLVSFTRFARRPARTTLKTTSGWIISCLPVSFGLVLSVSTQDSAQYSAVQASVR